MGLLRRRSFPEAWLLFALGLSLLVGAAVDVAYYASAGSAAPAEAQYPLPQVTGVLRLQHQGYLSRFPVGGPCKGLGPYNDLLGGTVVTVANETGATVATGSLDIGKVADRSTCEFGVVVPGLPTANHYQFSVDGRPVGSYSSGDLQTSGWQVTLAAG